MIRYSVYIFLLCLPFLTYGQSNTAGISTSLEKAKSLYSSGQMLEAVEFYKKAAQEFSEQKNYPKYGEIFNSISVIYQTVGMLDSALVYANQAFEIFSKEKQPREAIMQLSNMGAIYYSMGKLEQAYAKLTEGFGQCEEFNISSELHRLWCNVALVYYVQGQYDTALASFTTAYELSKTDGTQRDVAFNLGNIAMVHQVTGQYDKALQTYLEVLQLLENLGDADGQLRTINNIAQVYQLKGAYDEALKYADIGLKQAREWKLNYHIAALSSTVGYIYYYRGQYTEAVAAFRSSIEIFTQMGFKENIISGIIAMGMVYQAWGVWEKSYACYQDAYKRAVTGSMPHLVGQAMYLMGNVSFAREEYTQALDESKSALEIFSRLNQPHKTGGPLTVMGMTYLYLGKFKKARESFTGSMNINNNYNHLGGLAVDHVHLGAVHQAMGNIDTALVHYRRAESLLEQLNMKAQLAVCLSNIGAIKLSINEPDSAIRFLEASINIKESLRLTAEGDMRRDYLASQLSTYGYLINACIFNGNPYKAWEASELSSAKYLAESIINKDTSIEVPQLRSMQKSLPGSIAVIKFANMNRFYSARLILTADTANGYVVFDTISLFDTINFIGTELIEPMTHRGFKLKTQKSKIEDPVDDISKNKSFIEAVKKYRILLQRPAIKKDEQNLRILSKQLYSFLFGDIEKEIKDKSELLILPDGILAFLPFETLIMPDGRYLCEKYRISYAQSLIVANLASNRTFKSKRKSLLAIGDPKYSQIPIETITKRSTAEIRNALESADSTGSPTTGLYRSLGIGTWQQLPGAAEEIKKICSIVRGAEKITGKKATELHLKTTELGDYRILHFATHGIAVPQLPQLSALILSTPEKPDNRDDGYLRMNEIIELNLSADFVNLSACETGLGKIYSGEGVVGLTQAFLLAGAKSLAVSLWQVADESTALFMTDLYRLVHREGGTFPEAMTTVKKNFLNGTYGETFRHPFFWAPFVLYGL